MDESASGSNDLLSQSYLRGLERITQSKENLDYFHIPEHITDNRKRVWDNLFEKYSTKLTDDIEITLDSPSEEEANEEELKYVERRPEELPAEGLKEDYEENSLDPSEAGAPQEEYADDNDDDDDDEEDIAGDNKRSFNKNRVPIRKSTASIQYWLDTGKAPFLTTEAPEMLHELIPSNSGSSLSEGEPPNPDKFPIISNLIPTERASNSTSVDTGPYIRSTNVTNKSEMLVIMRSSRSPETPLASGDPLAEECSETRDPLATDRSRLNVFAHQENEDNCDNNNQSLDKSQEASMILSKLEEKVERSLNKSRLTSCDGSDSEVRNIMAPSMKISDVLEDLGEHIDKLTTKSTVKQLRKEPEVGSGESSGRGTPKFLSLMKKGNRRKLWTGRNSPMDIIVSSTMDSEDQIVPKTGNLHPALQGTPKARVPNLKKRATLNARRQSRVFLNRDNSRNSKDSSDPPSDGREKKFLKNLGLVPSPRFNTKTKRKIIGGIVRRKSLRRRPKRKIQYREVDSGSNKDECSDSSLESSAAELENLLSLCAKKILTVPLERINETFLARTTCKAGEAKNGSFESDLQSGRISALGSTAGVSPAETKGISSRNMRRVPQAQQIELDSQESDQSTIIMMQCEEKEEEDSAPHTRSKQSTSSSKKPEGDGRREEKRISGLSEDLKSSIDFGKFQEAAETAESEAVDEGGEKKSLSEFSRRLKKSVGDSKKPQRAGDTGGSTSSEKRAEKERGSVLSRRSKKSATDSEQSQGDIETEVLIPSNEKVERNKIGRPRHSRKSVIDSKNPQEGTEMQESTADGGIKEKTTLSVLPQSSKLLFALLTRSEKSINYAKQPQGATEAETAATKDERGEKKTVSILPRRSRKSVTDSEKSQTAVDPRQSSQGDDRKEIKKLPTRRRRPQKSSPYPTRSRALFSDSDRPQADIINGDLTLKEEKIKEKLDNRTVRMSRQRSALTNQKNELAKRKNRKVNAKKMNVKHWNDKKELPGINDSSKTYPDPGGEKNQYDEDEEKTEQEEKERILITATVTIDSDSYSESSRDMNTQRTIGIRRRCLKPAIKFFSDDDSDFITKMEMSYNRAQRRSQKRSQTLEEDGLFEDEKRIIDDLNTENSPIFVGTILLSDEEEVYESSKVKIQKTSTRTTRKGWSGSGKAERTKSPEKSVRSVMRPSLVRVLSYDDTSSKKSEEMDESPPKKLKIETGAIHRSGSSVVNGDRSFKGVELDSNASSGSMRILLGRSPASSGIKRKAESRDHCDQTANASDIKKELVRRSHSPVEGVRSLSPVVNLLRESPVERLVSPIKSPSEKHQAAIKSPDKRLPLKKKKLGKTKLVESGVSFEKMPDDLGTSFKLDSRKSSSVMSPVKPINKSRNVNSSVRKNTRSSYRRVLTSDDESSVDFCLRETVDNNDKLVDDESSEVDSIKCTKLFHNPFEGTEELLRIPINKKYEKSRPSKTITNNLRKKSVMTFRTRDNSDSDD